MNHVAKEIAEREAKLLPSSRFDAADVSDEHSTSSVAFVNTGLSSGDHLDADNQCHDVTSAYGDINKQCGTEEVTNFDHDVCVELGDDAESCYPQTVCCSELQYTSLTTEGHQGVVTALKDPGAEISLVKAELVQDKNLPSVGSVVIQGILDEPIRAKRVMMTNKPAREAAFEYIGPVLNVIFAVGPLTVESDMI